MLQQPAQTETGWDCPSSVMDGTGSSGVLVLLLTLTGGCTLRVYPGNRKFPVGSITKVPLHFQ